MCSALHLLYARPLFCLSLLWSSFVWIALCVCVCLFSQARVSVLFWLNEQLQCSSNGSERGVQVIRKTCTNAHKHSHTEPQTMKEKMLRTHTHTSRYIWSSLSLVHYQLNKKNAYEPLYNGCMRSGNQCSLHKLLCCVCVCVRFFLFAFELLSLVLPSPTLLQRV